MPRKPAHLELAGGKGPRQRIWDEIRKTRSEPFEVAAVTPGSVPLDTARTYVRSLCKAGYLGDVQVIASNRAHYILIRDAGLEAPRVRRDGSPVTMGLAQEQMWRTLRLLAGDTNSRELAAHASTPEVPVSPVAAADYLRTLHCANYLQCTKEGKGTGRGGILARYRLISNTGPRPPMVCRADALYDPNLGATVWVRPVTEEDALYV